MEPWEEDQEVTIKDLVTTIHELPGVLLSGLGNILWAFLMMGIAFLPFVLIGMITS